MGYISIAAQKPKTQVPKALFDKEEVMKKFLHWGLLIIGLGALLYMILAACGIIHSQTDITVIVAFIPLYYALFFSLRDDIKGLDKKIDKVADEADKKIDKVADDVGEIKITLARHEERLSRLEGGE